MTINSFSIVQAKQPIKHGLLFNPKRYRTTIGPTQVLTMTDLVISIRDTVGQLQWEVEARSLGQSNEAGISLGYARAACLPRQRLWHRYCSTREGKGTAAQGSVFPKNFYLLYEAELTSSDFRLRIHSRPVSTPWSLVLLIV